MVGSYSSTKWFWMSWMVSALLPTPPAPTTTSLYSVILAAAAHHTNATAGGGEQKKERKMQVSSTKKHTWLGFSRTTDSSNLFSATGLRWCSPQPAAQWLETSVLFVCVCVCVLQWVCMMGTQVETLKGKCENMLSQSVSETAYTQASQYGRLPLNARWQTPEQELSNF